MYLGSDRLSLQLHVRSQMHSCGRRLPDEVYWRLRGLWRKGLDWCLWIDLGWDIACRILEDWGRSGLGPPHRLVRLLLFLHLAKHVFGLCFEVRVDLCGGERSRGRCRL